MIMCPEHAQERAKNEYNELVEEVAAAIDYQAFKGTPEQVHMYCSPYRVDVIQNHARASAVAALGVARQRIIDPLLAQIAFMRHLTKVKIVDCMIYERDGEVPIRVLRHSDTLVTVVIDLKDYVLVPKELYGQPLSELFPSEKFTIPPKE